MDPWSTLLLLIGDKTNRLSLGPKRIYQSRGCEDAEKNVISDKNITHFHSKSSRFGDFERTQNTAVFLATAQQTVVLRVNVNT
jgi:hypothetical protein